MSWFGDIVGGVTEAVGGAVRAVSDGVVSAADAVGVRQAMGYKYTTDLNDKFLLKILVDCAADCYEDWNTTGPNVRLGASVQRVKNCAGRSLSNYSVYKIVQGRHSGKIVVAYRGTADANDVVKDVELTLASFGHTYNIRSTITDAVNAARSNNASFVTGHSLGGMVAECVCAHTGIGGASFNAPGPWSANPAGNLVDGDSYGDVPFEIHLTASDPVSMVGGVGGPDRSHIGTPKWHSHGGMHGILAMQGVIGRL